MHRDFTAGAPRGRCYSADASINGQTMQTLKALLVEDNADDAELLASKVKEAGYILEWIRVDNEAEQRRTQEALRNSVQLLRSIVDHTMDCIMVVTPECIVSEINKPGLEMLEADSLAAAQTKRFVEFIMPPYRQVFQDVLRRVLAGKSELVEFEVLGLKGRRRWLETQAGPLQGAAARVEALICITRDVTERKRTEAQIRGQLDELQRWRAVTLGREDRVLSLKEEVNALLTELGRPPRYSSAATDDK